MTAIGQDNQVTQQQTQKSRGKRMVITLGSLSAVIILALGVFFHNELVSACKLLFRLQPTHAKHIPRTALTVARTNFAAVALKAGLRGSASDPMHKKLLEYGTKLYPRFDQFLANPVKESGIEFAEDSYAFLEMLDESTPGLGVLFGISNQERFAKFLQNIKPGSPTTEAGVSMVQLDSGSSLYWNKSFGLIYSGPTNGRSKQRAMAIMAMNKADSIINDPLKKKWLEGRDDCQLSVDLENVAKFPEVSNALKKSLYKPEIYNGSSLTLALNFDKGKFGLDIRATGTALLAEISKTAKPLSKEFLAGIPADNYQGFLATHIQLIPILDAIRQADPEAYRRANDFTVMMTKTSIEQLTDSFTGDVCAVLENFSQRTTERSQGAGFSGLQLPAARSTSTHIEGTVAIGVKPNSAAVTLVHKLMQDASSSNSVIRDGKLYKINTGDGYYLVADNGYLALSTRREAAKSMAERKKDAPPVMPANILNLASSGMGIMEIKLASLFSAAANDRALSNETRSVIEQLSRLKELRVTSRLEKERSVSQCEIFFKDESKNSLNQITEMLVNIAENSFGQNR